MEKKPTRHFVDMRAACPTLPFNCIFDVGANVGQSVRNYRRSEPDAQIYAFEPVTAAFDQLANEFRDDPRVVCEKIALSIESGGEAEVTADGTSTFNTIVPAGTSKGPVETVQLESGDAYCERHGIQRIDFLKIDTEGHDLDVLLGFTRLLVHRKVAFLQVEAGMNPGNARHVNVKRFLGFLEPLGYEIFGVYDQVREKHRQNVLRRSNIIFSSRDLLSAR